MNSILRNIQYFVNNQKIPKIRAIIWYNVGNQFQVCQVCHVTGYRPGERDSMLWEWVTQSHDWIKRYIAGIYNRRTVSDLQLTVSSNRAICSRDLGIAGVRPELAFTNLHSNLHLQFAFSSLHLGLHLNLHFQTCICTCISICNLHFPNKKSRELALCKQIVNTKTLLLYIIKTRSRPGRETESRARERGTDWPGFTLLW